MFQILQGKGIEVDDRDIPDRQDSQLLLPLTRFDSEFEAEKMINKADDALRGSGLGSANLYSVVTTAFGELALNAVQHAGSPLGAYGFLQFYDSPKGQRFVCGVADGGIGVRRSLEKNPQLRGRVPYDWVALELAVRERVTGTLEPTRGMGLFGVAEDIRKTNRQLILHSGLGFLQIREDMQSEVRRTKLFPGTLAYASIPS